MKFHKFCTLPAKIFHSPLISACPFSDNSLNETHVTSSRYCFIMYTVWCLTLYPNPIYCWAPRIQLFYFNTNDTVIAIRYCYIRAIPSSKVTWQVDMFFIVWRQEILGVFSANQWCGLYAINSFTWPSLVTVSHCMSKFVCTDKFHNGTFPINYVVKDLV